MSRDYKPRNSNQSGRARSSARGGKRGGARGGTLIGIFIGLLIGVIFALGVAWYINRTPIPFLGSGKISADKSGESVLQPGQNQTPQNVPGSGPVALPGKPGDKAAEKATDKQTSDKPRFDFYKILPEGDQGTPAPPNQAASSNNASANQDKLYLQLGSFQNPADADNLKAKLALMGLEASVQQVNIADKGLLHRVRVGPYATAEEMGSVRSQLAQNGIQATVVKIKPKPPEAANSAAKQ